MFEYLRAEFPIHKLEEKLNARAEIILEAIDRASDLSLRGVRGLIAEAAFQADVVQKLAGWRTLPVPANAPYDFLQADEIGSVKIQVKMQRLKAGQPMRASQANRRLPADMYVVETQRTRGGLDSRTGESTRPYRFGDFDILAVSLQPSTGDWSSFIYTIASSLLPDTNNKVWILKFQPVPPQPTGNWTDDFETCVNLLRSK